MWLFVLPALAQDEVCSTYLVDRFRADLGVAASTLGSMRVQSGGDMLDQITDQARCLDAVLPKQDLARLAQLQAIRWFYEQDEVMFSSWAGLASATAPDLPWPVEEGHPVERLRTMIQVLPPVGPAGMGVAHPKKGGVWLDGTLLLEPKAAPEMRHFVQMFDDERPVLAYWQSGGAFRAEVLADHLTEPPKDLVEEEEPERPTFAAARRNTIPAYEHYLERHPTGEHAAEARRGLDELVWQQTTAVGTVEAVKAYLARFPEGLHRGQAEAVLEADELRNALALGTKEALQVFLTRHPKGIYSAAARARLDDVDWAETVGQGTAQAYARYLLQWPDGQHVTEARLAQQDKVWAAAVRDGEAGYRRYLEKYPKGQRTVEARRALESMKFSRIAIQVQGVPMGVSAAAEALEQTLAAVIGRRGFEVDLLSRGGSGVPALAPGMAALVLVVGPPPGVGEWSVDAALHPALAAPPLVRYRVGAPTSEAAVLARYVADALPPLDAWRVP